MGAIAFYSGPGGSRPNPMLLCCTRNVNPKSNIWKDVVILNQGDVEKGFASSDHVIEF